MIGLLFARIVFGPICLLAFCVSSVWIVKAFHREEWEELYAALAISWLMLCILLMLAFPGVMWS